MPLPGVARIVAGAALAAGLAACASWDPAGYAPGTPRDQVIARAGRPTGVVPLAGGGERLQYSQQPAGRRAWMFDFDPQGRLQRVRQVFTAAEFQRIEPGTWREADVRREFGPPAQVERVANFRGVIWTYRWAEGNDPMFYWVYLDADGVVERAHPGIEHINGPNDAKD